MFYFVGFQAKAAVRAVAVGLAVVSATGCAPRIRYVPLERVRTDSVVLFRNVAQKVTVRDSIVIEHRRDTVRMLQYRYVGERFERCDTVRIERCDTVAVPYPVTPEPGRWQRAKQQYGGWAFGLAAALALLLWRRR